MAGFNPIMEVGEDFAFEGSQWTFVVKTTALYMDKVAFRTIRKWVCWEGGVQDGKIKILLLPKVSGLQLAARASICSSI